MTGCDIWARPIVNPHAGTRNEERAIEDKESQRWLEGYRDANEIAKQTPQTMIVSIADRERDVSSKLPNRRSESRRIGSRAPLRTAVSDLRKTTIVRKRSCARRLRTWKSRLVYQEESRSLGRRTEVITQGVTSR